MKALNYYHYGNSTMVTVAVLRVNNIKTKILSF